MSNFNNKTPNIEKTFTNFHDNNSASNNNPFINNNSNKPKAINDLNDQE